MDQEVLDENELILGMMRRDGVDLTCPYRVEHHFSGSNFELLEKLAIALYSLGLEVTDPDEFTDERGRTAFAFDAFREMIPDGAAIAADQEKFWPKLATFRATYDGWGVDVGGGSPDDDAGEESPDEAEED